VARNFLTGLRLVNLTSDPPTGSEGELYYNTVSDKVRLYSNGAWIDLGDGAGATGGGTDQVFHNNDQSVTTNYSIPAGKNSMSAGPITINNGVTVTIPSGLAWVVL